MAKRLLSPQTLGGFGSILLTIVIFFAQGGFVNMNLWYVAGLIIGVGLIVWGLLKNSDGQTKTKNIPLYEIKDDLIILNSREKEAAAKRVKESYSEEIAIRIYDNFVATFGGNIASIVTNVIKKIVQKQNTDPLIEFYKKLGDILDSVNFGLKRLLEDDNLYKTTLEDLAKQRVRIKGSKKKRTIIQDNVARVRDISYGLNSSVILRGVLTYLPSERLQLLSMVVINLEGIEKSMETTLSAMLNDLENEWKVKDEEIRSFEAILPALAFLEGLSKYE